MAERFAGAGLDRAGERRTDSAWVAERRADPSSRAVVVTRDGVAVADAGDVVSGAASWDEARGGSDAARLARVPVAGVAAAGGAREAVLLGLEPDGTALFGVALDAVPDGTQAVALRDAASLLPAGEAGIAAYATAILTWHRTHPHCARCGHPTDMAEAGFVRRCPSCGAQHHPRTDPVVIMLVTRGDEVLLGRQPSWPAGRYSALAGFVEPGESLEEAVAREVREEAGVEVSRPRYVASQPWPFPASLMLGFIAEHASGEPQVRDAELEDVRWFAVDEVRAAARGEGDIGLPPPLAIARTLIDTRLGV
jgi:NAD+ diphosphatase